MSHKKIVRECESKTAEAGNFCLKYYISYRESDNCFSNEAASGLVYGISIKKETVRRGSIVAWEEEEIDSLFYSEAEARNAVNLLADMGVTPITLVYVMDDYMSYPPCSEALFAHN